MSERPIRRLLIANRAEIARRILRSAHDMGIATVAVYADPDRDAPYVHEADVAVALEGRTSSETYLDPMKILAAATRTGADAVHPGYGFLAENADFARACESADLIFVGPSPDAIAAMGDKLSAKRIMEEAGVPTLPAVELADGATTGDAETAAADIGFPLLVKAAAGGGGKGMRIVHRASELEAAIEGARREAGSSFGDDTIFLERYLERARHVEIQLLGDRHGQLVHCFERECSIQRRHQKIIEEAPSPVVSPELRARMGEAAVAAGQAIGYSSAGTVEFLVEETEDGPGEFWFLEVNTRLQVEHPVTEAITGLDLVREQLRIAQGEPLGFEQDDLGISGHAIEARLYAEDPANGFLPATGRLLAWEPAVGARFDSGIEAGSEVGIEFDPMLAKVIVHAPSRREAALRLARVLETTRVQGLVTNRDFLVETLRTPEFLAGDTTTDFLERVSPGARREPEAETILQAALAAALADQHDRRAAAQLLPNVPSGWCYTRMPPQWVVYRHVGGSPDEGSEEEIRLEYRHLRFAAVPDTFWTRCQTSQLETEPEVRVLERTGDAIVLEIDGLRVACSVTCEGDRRLVHGPGGDVELIEMPRFPVPGSEGVEGGLTAPMPGKVLSVRVAQGERVEERQLLLVLEAMKMEHRITAPHAGVVAEVRVAEGDQVDNGELLVRIEDAEGAAKGDGA